jgi:hypothetical protein
MKHKRQISFALGGSVMVHLLLVGGVTTLLAFSRVSPPVNDDFKRAGELLTGGEGSRLGDNLYATRETFEPAHAATVAGGSVWWRWKAEKSCEVEVNVIARDFEEVVGVYRGAVLETLVEVEARDAGDQWPIRFSAEQGTAYYIAVAGSGRQQSGSMAVNIVICSDDEDEREAEELVLLLPEMFVIDEAEQKEKPDDLGYVRTSARDSSEEAPDDSRLESDHNTLAASEIMPEEQGEEDTPNLDGEDLPFGDLVRSDYIDGELDDAGALPVAPLWMPQAGIRPKQPDEPGTPIPAQVVDTGSGTLLSEDARQAGVGMPGDFSRSDHASSVDEVANTQNSELVASRESRAETDNEVPEVASASVQEEIKAPEDDDRKIVAGPGNEEAVGELEERHQAFQTHTAKKRLAGQLSNIGNPALDVSETPLGHYKKKVDQAVQRSWHRARIARGDFAKYGSLKIRFWIERSGKIVELKVLRNDADPVMVDFSISGIRDADLPPVPGELIDKTQDGRMEFDYEIIIY